MEGIRRERRYSQAPTVGYGYIIIPFNVEADEYISNCYTRERVCIMAEHGGSIVKDCYISKQALRDVEFPDISDNNKYKTGSAVVYVTDGFNNKPTIIGVLSKEDETQLLTEFKFKNAKYYKKNSVIIEGNAQDGVLGISVSDGEDEGVINVDIKGKTGGKLNINCQTEATISANSKIHLKTTGEVEITTYNSSDGEINSSFKIDAENVEIKPKQLFNVGEATSPIPLGDKNKEVFEDIQLILNNLNTKIASFASTQAAVSTAAVAPSPLVPLAAGFSTLGTDMAAILTDITDIVVKIAQINSIKSFID